MTTATNERDRLIDWLLAAKSAHIIAHIQPDADTLGAALGLAWALEELDIACQVVCQDPVPHELHFLPGSERVSAAPYGGQEVVLAVDASDERRLGSLYRRDAFGSAPLLVIDHHVTNTRYGDLNWVQDVPATSEMILDMLQLRGINISSKTATCLLAGIVGDTQCFITSNTAPSSLLAAAKLQQLGAPLVEIASSVLNRRPYSALAVWRQAMTAAVNERGVLITALDHDYLTSVQADDSSTNGLSSWLVGLDGVLISAVMRETAPRIVDVSMRSVSPIDISAAAKAMGGGGHPQAAGCVLHMSLTAARSYLLEMLLPLVAESAP
ncbi:MAG: hypothetical protein GXY52_00635 [Chloroflexi bacterium]|nr:hypothetical protein [Chloroflexota bacterium]